MPLQVSFARTIGRIRDRRRRAWLGRGFPPPVAQRSVGLVGISEPNHAPVTILNPGSGRSVGCILITGKVRSGGKGEQNAEQQHGGDHQGIPVARQQVMTADGLWQVGGMFTLPGSINASVPKLVQIQT